MYNFLSVDLPEQNTYICIFGHRHSISSSFVYFNLCGIPKSGHSGYKTSYERPSLIWILKCSNELFYRHAHLISRTLSPMILWVNSLKKAENSVRALQKVNKLVILGLNGVPDHLAFPIFLCHKLYAWKYPKSLSISSIHIITMLILNLN